MENVYIVKKEQMAQIVIKPNSTANIPLSTNEGVFANEDDAKDYIKKRKALKDRDDRGCTFNIEPWRVQ